MDAKRISAATVGAALLAVPLVAQADHRPTSFLVTSPLNTSAPCPQRSPCGSARRDANRTMIAAGGIVFTVTYGLTAAIGAISLNPPTESSWVREDGWWLVPGAGGFIAGVHRSALGDPGGLTRIAIGAALGVVQSSGVYLMVEGIRRFGRTQQVARRAALTVPFVTIDATGTAFGLTGTF